MGKKLAPQGENLPNGAPSRRALQGPETCPLIRPFGPPSPQGEGFWGDSPLIRPPSGSPPPEGKALGRIAPSSTLGEDLNAAKSPRKALNPLQLLNGLLDGLFGK